jgi:hypothetical protein
MFALRALLPLFYLLHVVSATPTGTIVRRVDGDPASDSVSASASSASASAPSSSASSSPDADAFLQNHFTIDQSCTRTGAGIQNGAKKQPMLEQAVKDAAILLHEAQSIQRDDPAYALCLDVPHSLSLMRGCSVSTDTFCPRASETKMTLILFKKCSLRY